jgi:uncharacterized membrane protein
VNRLVNLNKSMYDVLMGGMILSSVTYVVGIVLFLYQNQTPLQASVVHYQSVAEFAKALLAVRSAAVLTLATVFLIATPITRVLISIFVFAFNRNPKYVAVTTIVLLILIGSILLGYFGHFVPQ